MANKNENVYVAVEVYYLMNIFQCNILYCWYGDLVDSLIKVTFWTSIHLSSFDYQILDETKMKIVDVVVVIHYLWEYSFIQHCSLSSWWPFRAFDRGFNKNTHFHMFF